MRNTNEFMYLKKVTLKSAHIVQIFLLKTLEVLIVTSPQRYEVIIGLSKERPYLVLALNQGGGSVCDLLSKQ